MSRVYLSNGVIKGGGAGIVIQGDHDVFMDRVSITDTAGPAIAVLPPHLPIPAELLGQLKQAVAEQATTLEPGLIERFKALGIDVVDWVGRGLTLAQLLQLLLGSPPA